MPHRAVIGADSVHGTVFVSGHGCRAGVCVPGKSDAALRVLRWELGGPAKTANALGVVLLRPDGGVLAQGGASAPLMEETVAAAMRGEMERRGTGVYVMHLSVGRLVIARGKSVAVATLFRHAPGKEVVSVLERTVTAIEGDLKAADKTFGNPAPAARYADAPLKPVPGIAG